MTSERNIEIIFSYVQLIFLGMISFLLKLYRFTVEVETHESGGLSSLLTFLPRYSLHGNFTPTDLIISLFPVGLCSKYSKSHINMFSDK